MELPRPLTPEEQEKVHCFEIEAQRHLKTKGMEENWNLELIAVEANVNLFELPKDGVVIQAIWVAFLSAMKSVLPLSSLKYPTILDFQKAYNGYFDECTPKEFDFLWQTANWMNKMFEFVPARKNKGLVIAIVPKVIEGWYAKYVTGSGQTKATSDRVKIFETEGGVLPSHRGRVKPKKRPSSAHRVSRKATEHTKEKERKYGRKGKISRGMSMSSASCSSPSRDHALFSSSPYYSTAGAVPSSNCSSLSDELSDCDCDSLDDWQACDVDETKHCNASTNKIDGVKPEASSECDVLSSVSFQDGGLVCESGDVEEGAGGGDRFEEMLELLCQQSGSMLPTADLTELSRLVSNCSFFHSSSSSAIASSHVVKFNDMSSSLNPCFLDAEMCCVKPTINPPEEADINCCWDELVSIFGGHVESISSGQNDQIEKSW